MSTHKAAPAFAGSAIINSDGDFISVATLFEFNILRVQLLYYLLVDFDDAYHLEGIAYYSAWYGHLKACRRHKDSYPSLPASILKLGKNVTDSEALSPTAALIRSGIPRGGSRRI
ncbi:hypothetical protein IUQ79_14535 [Mycobacteroides abscessus subsp. bolletii]|uniref:hypothetical protein n=1 Tax=Mycobacteroides abscessus TaxID=36809 RepID=UPI0019D05F2A|nr:hypothetical protein [Mycobacteroides abscessus]MBN7303119.1 hypothetical protein [Mycobacteroides abscessus subsp. bolletii]